MAMPDFFPATSTNVHAPAANAAAVITLAADAGRRYALHGVAWSYSATPTAGNLKVEDGAGTTVFSIDITSAGAGFFDFIPPLGGTPGTAMIVTLAPGGSGVSGKVSIKGYRKLT